MGATSVGSDSEAARERTTAERVEAKEEASWSDDSSDRRVSSSCCWRLIFVEFFSRPFSNLVRAAWKFQAVKVYLREQFRLKKNS